MTVRLDVAQLCPLKVSMRLHWRITNTLFPSAHKDVPHYIASLSRSLLESDFRLLPVGCLSGGRLSPLLRQFARSAYFDGPISGGKLSTELHTRFRLIFWELPFVNDTQLWTLMDQPTNC